MARRDRLRADVRAILERDPATEHVLEAILTTPGLWARWTHRLASWLWTHDRRLTAGLLSTLARLVTGIELHPAAEIGDRVVIDHGQGVVVGATATVGDGVLCYHGVTLGARGRHDGERHPTVGDGVVLGARSTVLGSIEIGDGATVGAGAVVLEDVPDGTTVVGVPAQSVSDGAGARAGDARAGNPCNPDEAGSTDDSHEAGSTDDSHEAGSTDEPDDREGTDDCGDERDEAGNPGRTTLAGSRCR